MTKTKLILASTSPRRKQILEMLGLEFEVRAVEVDESIIAGESPYDYVHRLAIAKAQAGLSANTEAGNNKEINTEAITAAEDIVVEHETIERSQATQELIIGGDVTIDRDGIALAKAESPAEARQMLASLSGKTHMVRDAFALTSSGELLSSGVTTSMVTFRDLSEEDIDAYLSSGEWEGKAGAYAIQGKAADFITDIQGSFYDILGLPIYAVAAALISTHLPEFQGLAEKIKQIAARDKALISSVLKRS